MTEYATADNLTRLFLYGLTNGQITTPEELTDRLRDTDPESIGANVNITAQNYMDSWGKYAVPARAEFVNKFFNGVVTLSTGVHTVADLKVIYGDSMFRFSFQHAQVDIGNERYMERSYVFGHASFNLSDDTEFVVDSSGNLSMQNVKVVPENDNFDFKSTSMAQYLNEYFLIPNIDPSGIGRTVSVTYTGSVSPVLYSSSAFASDVLRIASWDASQGAAVTYIGANIAAFVNNMKEDGVFENFRDGKDIIYDGSGEDELTFRSSGVGGIFVGGGGDDDIYTTTFGDVAYGGSGNDTFLASPGDDEFWGGNEPEKPEITDLDTVDYSNAPGRVTIRFEGYGDEPSLEVLGGFGGTQRLHSIEKIVATAHSDYLNLSGEIPAGYNLTIDMGDGADVIANAEGASGRIVVNIGTNGTGTASTPDGGGTIDLLNAKTQIIGSYYDDEITDLAEHDGLKRIDGKDGDDVITVDGSDAMIRGGYDDDTLTGGTGNDVLYGDDGDDILHGGEGSDFLETRHADTEADTAEEEDELYGDEGHDYLRASANSTGATLSGGAGNDAIDARGSNVTVVFGAGDGHDLILSDRALGDGYELGQGFDGVSRIDMTTVSKSGVTLIWDPQHLVEHILPNGNPQDTPGYLIREGDLAIRIDATGDTILVKNVRGMTSYWNDPSEASQPPFDGTFDEVQFFELLEMIEFSDGYIDFGDFLGSSPLVSLQFGSVAAYATALDDYRDAIAATPGGDGGTSGDDEMDGGAGDDSFGSSGGNDMIDGGGGRDVLNLFGTRENFTITSLGGGVFTIEDMTGFEGKITATSIEAIYFAGDNQEYAQEDIFGYYGTAGNDTLIASNLDNEIYGLDGDDTIHGLGGYDLIDGGVGFDTAYYAGPSEDFLIYRTLDGGIGLTDNSDDEGEFDEGSDTLISVEALHFAGDSLTIGLGDLPPLGTSAADILDGSARADRLFGLEGDDELSGLGRNDVLIGGLGNDTYSGGAGNDYLEDEGGNDVYHYGAGDEADTIADFGGTDILEMGTGIAPEDVIVTADWGSYLLTFTNSDGFIYILNGSLEDYAIEEIHFADETVWTDEDLYDMAFGQFLRQGEEPEMAMAAPFADAALWRSWGGGMMELRADLAVPI